MTTHSHRTDDVHSLDLLGLNILADVGVQLARGSGAEDVLSGVAGALCRGLQTEECRIWVRSPDGATFRAIGAEGATPPDEERTGAIKRYIDGDDGAQAPDAAANVCIRLAHEAERLGLLEARVDDGPYAPVLRRVLEIVAEILSPLLASFELSEDLASEVAVRTREIEMQRRFTSKIIDSLPVGLYVVDRDYRIQMWNRKRETGALGMEREEVVGRLVFDVLKRQPPALLKAEFDSVFATGRLEQVEVQSRASGGHRQYRITKVPMRLDDTEVSHVITIGEDITDWKSVQQQVAQTEKLAAVGQLAAGVMHELNNPLATIGACVEALSLRADEIAEPVRSGVDEYLRIVESELGRCKAIVDGLLDFSRPKSRVMRSEAVNPIVEDAIFLVKHHDRFKRIQLDLRLGESVPSIRGNKEQLIQVFLAIMLNAIDAMEGTGVLAVTTEYDRLRDEVLVAIADTGIGIAAEELPKIFEPFFSTKQPGRGTGLGLSICYGIVAQHGGTITVDSEVGRGSTFRVLLPRETKGAAE